MKKVLDSAKGAKKAPDSANDAQIRQILREFGYKIGRYDICDENAQSALDSATRALKNNRRVNRVTLFFLESVVDSAICRENAQSALDSANNTKGAESRVDSAKFCVFKKADLQNLMQNGVEITVFLKDSAEAKTTLDFWRTFGIVYLVKDSQNLA